jgi:iron complex transport system substrate-binding protein
VVQRWYLVQGGVKPPAGIDTTQIINVPVRNIICMSTTHLAMISALDEAGSVTGFSGTNFIYDRELEENVKNGSVHEIGYEDNLNKELIVRLKPDLVMIYGVGSESSGYMGKLNELGIKVFFNADYLEIDPLGKAEWIKLIGALYCKEQLADSIFRTIEENYSRIRSFIREKAFSRPDVLLGLPFKDTWYISPGNSYISKLISDAGGNYLWKDTQSSAALPASLETVYLKALKAEYWLNTGSAKTMEDIETIDPRLKDLASYKKGNIFNNNKRINSGGGNDYWEGGSLNPHIVLGDIAAILHPELFPGSELYYYKRLGRRNN